MLQGWEKTKRQRNRKGRITAFLKTWAESCSNGRSPKQKGKGEILKMLWWTEYLATTEFKGFLVIKISQCQKFSQFKAWQNNKVLCLCVYPDKGQRKWEAWTSRLPGYCFWRKVPIWNFACSVINVPISTWFVIKTMSLFVQHSHEAIPHSGCGEVGALSENLTFTFSAWV